MILFINVCTWWWLPWLLLPLLGLLLGWALWAKYKDQVAGLETEVSSLKKRITGLEADLAECRSMRADLEGDLALTKGRMREMEAQMAAGEGASGADLGNIAAGFAAGSASTESDAGATNIYGGIPDDNLQIIEGIGPKMESVLKENGVNTIGDLAGQSVDDINAILGKYGDKYTRIIDPSTWPQQAGLAHEGKYEDLIYLQKTLDTGKADATNMTDSKLEKVMIKMGLLKKYKQDDLKAVEGIGPKIEGLLKDAGIKTWRELANTSVARIQEILDAAGSRYKLADPGTWPKQSEMAADGKWKELQEYQDFLQGGK